MRAAKFAIGLFLVGLINAHPQHNPGTGLAAEGCQAYIEDCVPYYQCIDGVINTSGEGLIDVRIAPVSQCEHPEYPGVVGLCCRIPGATPPPIQTCPGGLVCVENGQCKKDGSVNTDGGGLIDVRISSLVCYVHPDSPVTGVCCKPPPVEYCPGNQVCVSAQECSAGAAVAGNGGSLSYTECHIDQANYVTGVCCDLPIIALCPGDSVCLPDFLCPGEILNNYDEFVPQTNGGPWSQCAVSGDYQIKGVCCRNPVTLPPQPPPAAGQCGVRNYGLDVRSQLQKNEAQFAEFPWQAVLFFSNYTFKCGASLVGERWLITGAHCVAGYQYGDFKIRLGEWQVDTYEELLPYVDVDIASFVVHPDFNPKNLHNDIAVIELAAPIPFQYHINTVCLPSAGQYPVPGSRCFASGWGKDAFTGAYQAILKKVDVPVVEKSYCQELLRKTRLGKYFLLDKSFVCAGGEAGIDACTGDGGGPLVCQYPNSDQYVLYGITAWGINCGQKDVPGVYVDVEYFADWIDGIIYGA